MATLRVPPSTLSYVVLVGRAFSNSFYILSDVTLDHQDLDFVSPVKLSHEGGLCLIIFSYSLNEYVVIHLASEDLFPNTLFT
jgi:hypothetical protein